VGPLILLEPWITKIAALCIALTCSGMNGLLWLLPEKKRANDVIFFSCDTTCYHLVSLSDASEFLVVTTPNSAVVCSQYHSSGMLPHQKNTGARKISHHHFFCSTSSWSPATGLTCCML
jgi:hypothetical protein